MRNALKILVTLGAALFCASLIQAAPPSQNDKGPGAASCSDMPPATIEVVAVLCADTESSSVGNIPPNDFKKQQDKDGLVGKVVAAAFKLAQGKPCDADQKLRDYETSLVLLMLTADSPKAKISEAKGDQLHTDLVAAQAAVGSLVCQ